MFPFKSELLEIVIRVWPLPIPTGVRLYDLDLCRDLRVYDGMVRKEKKRKRPPRAKRTKTSGTLPSFLLFCKTRKSLTLFFLPPLCMKDEMHFASLFSILYSMYTLLTPRSKGRKGLAN